MGVYKEGKNWKVQVYYKDWQGNQKRKQKRGFRTKGEAKEWERDFLQQQSQGVDIEFGNFSCCICSDMVLEESGSKDSAQISFFFRELEYRYLSYLREHW